MSDEQLNKLIMTILNEHEILSTAKLNILQIVAIETKIDSMYIAN